MELFEALLGSLGGTTPAGSSTPPTSCSWAGGAVPALRRRGHKPSSTWSTIQREWRGVCWLPTFVGIYRGACAIQLEDSVVVTGGYAPKNTPRSEAPHKAFRRVQRYNLAGSLGRLTDLGSGRYDHACGHYVQDGRVVRLLSAKQTYIS